MSKKLVLGLLVSIFLVGCITFSLADTNSASNTKATTTKNSTIKSATDNVSTDTISYEKYCKIFEQMDKDLKFDGYTKTLSSIGNLRLIGIDAEDSFGTRKFITESGKEDYSITQNRIEYANKNKTEYVFVDYVFLKNPLNKDMAYIDTPLSSTISNNMLQETVLTYKNTMAIVKVFSKNGNDTIGDRMMKVNKTVVKYLNSVGY